MRRQTSLLFLGLFAAAAGAQVAACSSDDSNPGTSTGTDAGSDTGVVQQEDSGGGAPTTIPGCNGPLPVMTIRVDGGGQGTPDWSCYASGGSFYDLEDGGADADAATDASDAATDAPPVTDSGLDGAVPPSDAGTDASTSPNYLIHITDFSSTLPPINATVDVFWGNSTEGTAAFTGVVDDAGLLAYPAPPAGTDILSYFIHSSSTQEAVHWHSASVIPPGVNVPNLGNGRFEGNSVSTTTEGALLTAVFGSETPSAALGILVTDAVDCAGNDVQGAQFTVFDGATGQAVTTSSAVGGVRAFYFVNNLPNQKCTYTNDTAKGVWVMANAPVNEPGATHAYTLRMTGRKYATDPAEGVTLDEVPLELYPGAISIARPYKYNGPAPNTP